MGLVTGVAQHAAGVPGSGDLGEGFGFRRVLFVAAGAEGGDVRERGLIGLTVHLGVGVFRLGSVAGLAGHVSVSSCGTHFGLVVVAHHAGVLPGVRDGVLANGGERARAVVSVLAEAFWNHGGPNHQE